MVDKAAELNLPFLALTDLHSISGIPEFYQTLKKKNKGRANPIKPILGCTLRVKHQNVTGTLTVWCKNHQGWKDLIKIVGESELGENGELYTTLDKIKGDNLVVIIGGLGSLCAKLFISNYHDAYLNDAVPELNTPAAYAFFDVLEHKFNKAKFVGEYHNLPIEQVLNKELEAYGEICFVNPVYYVAQEDQRFQQIVTCSKAKTTLNEIPDTISQSDYTRIFFEANASYLQVPELNSSLIAIVDSIESFEIAQKPQIPKYTNNNFPGKTSDEILHKYCQDGWARRGLAAKTKDNPALKKVYVDRINEELALFKEVGLSDYILIIEDFARYCKSCGVSCGLRGSAAGLFMSYLLGISDIDAVVPDPILGYKKERELLLSRFFHKGRMAGDNISLPDIDLDIPISFREKLISYCREKYGYNCVSHIITFGRMDARAAIKEAFRILDKVPNHFQISNEITSYLVDKAKVQDDLEDLREDNPKYNITQYCIDHIPRIAEYAKEYPEEFEVALRLTDLVRNQGKHAAGIVIGTTALDEMFPVTKDPKTGDPILAVEMEYAEYLGAVKYDLLGVAAYEKIDLITAMINGGLKSPPRLDVDEDADFDFGG